MQGSQFQKFLTLKYNCDIQINGNIVQSGAITNNSFVDSPVYKTNGTSGSSGVFTTPDSKTVTVQNGLITSIA